MELEFELLNVCIYYILIKFDYYKQRENEIIVIVKVLWDFQLFEINF